MTTTELSEELKNLILNGFPEDNWNPLSNGKLRFDEICISNIYDSSGGVKVEFFWCGKPTLWIRVEDVGIKDNKKMHLMGITGEQDFTIY